MSKASPTSKALRDFRALGYRIEKVEQRLPIPGKFITRDLFDTFDLIGVKVGVPLLAVQVTSRDNINARMTKAQQKGAALEWVQCQGRFLVIGYGGVKTTKRVVELLPDGMWQDRTQLT